MSLDEIDVDSLREDVARDRMNLISDIVKISQTPAPTFEEGERADVLAARFREEKINDVYVDPEGNVVAHRKSRDVPPVCVTAHLDTVFDSTVDHTVTVNDRTISGPGVGDDSLGLATLLSILRLLPESEPGNLVLVGTTGTEGQGNLRGSRYFVDNYQERLSFALCLEGHGLGRIDHWSLGTVRLHISAESQGGHVWRDETGENPIGVISQLVSRVHQLKEQTVDPEPFGVVNTGRIEGGSSFNTVPYSCGLDLEIRSDNRKVKEELIEEVNKIVNEVASETSLALKVQEVTRRPVSGIPEDHELIRIIESIHQNLGIESTKGPASSDSCIFLDAGIPTVTLGLARGTHRHHKDEAIEISSLESGQVQLLLTLLEVSKQLR